VSSAKKKSSKKKLLIALVLLVLLGAGATAYFKKKGGGELEYREIAVERGTIEVNVLATGVVQPENRLEVKPAIAGRAEQVLVKEGDLVKKGQTLVIMSSTERAVMLDSARAHGAAALKTWEELYKPAPILAPVSGTIILKNIEAGQTFATTDSILVMSDRLTVQAQVDETDIGSVRVKQPAFIYLDAYPTQKIEGVVDKVAFEAKTVNNVTTYIATILPAKVPDFMRSGMTANVTFNVLAKENVIVIPADAIKTRANQKFVTIVTGDKGQTAERQISTGITDGKRVEVVDGLADTDKLQVPRLSSLMKNKNGANPFGGPMNNNSKRPGGGSAPPPPR
jgi:macrolide-specific efflux system membrane fusion protein